MKFEESEDRKTDLIFVRHAESENNAAIFRFVQGKDMEYTWENVSKHQEFINGIKYNPKLIDCSITEQGKRQCKEACIYTNYLKPDVVLVSPLERALETCYILFGKRNIPIFVEPILTEGLRSACDISEEMNKKIQKYKQWNFSQKLIHDDLWFVSHQQPEMKEKILNKLKELDEQAAYQLKKNKILELMKQTQIYELSSSIRQRAKQIKKLLSKYKQKYETIAIVAHYNSINFTITREFNERDEPVGSPHINNCQVYHDLLGDILKYE